MRRCIAALRSGIAALILFVFTPALPAQIFGGGPDWKDNVTVYVHLDPLRVTSDESGEKQVSKLLLTNPGNVSIILKEKLRPETASIEVFHKLKAAAAPAAAATLTNSAPTASFSTLLERGADGEYPDGTLEIFHRAEGQRSAAPLRVELVAARRSVFFPTFSAGAVYTQNARKRYTLVKALDASGNEIPERSRIQEDRNDESITTVLSGKYYYLFGEQQGPVIRTLQEFFSLGLFVPGATRFGMFFGVAGADDQDPSYQLGASFFPNREPILAFSVGLNFTQGEKLISGFGKNDIVSMANLTDVTRRNWETGLFFSITFNPPVTKGD